jgi:hypothetical protein
MMVRAAPWLAPAALAVAMGAAAVFLLAVGDDFTFYVDQWDFMLERRGHGVDVFLDEQNGHLMAVPILVHKALFEVFGVESYLPFQLTAVVVQLAAAGLFFAIVRRRVDDALAVAFTVAVLFFGPGWEPLLSAVGMLNIIGLAAGLGMLLALDAGSRRGDVVATVMLTISIASFSYGPMFAVAAAVDILLRPGAARRLWVPAIPLALYGMWELGWGGESHTRWDNLPGVPRSIADSASAVAVSLTGLYRHPGEAWVTNPVDTTFGPPLALALAGVVAYRLRGPARESPRLWALVVLTLLLWLSIALVQDEGRTTESSRYLYPGGVFVLLIIAELLKGVRLGRRGQAAVAVWLAVVLVAGVGNLRWAADEFDEHARFTGTELAALELARGTVSPEYSPEGSVHDLVRGHWLYAVVAGPYFAAIDDYGSPAYSLAELRRAPPEPRLAADLLLAEATGLQAEPTSETARGCNRLTPREDAPGQAVLTVPPSGLVIDGDQGTPLELRLRRFADVFGVELGEIDGRDRVEVKPAPDSAAEVPWRAQLDRIRRPLRVCGA